MQCYISSLLRSQDAKEIQEEYQMLLSVGVAEDDAKNAIISFFLTDSSDDQKRRFWILFAVIQWKLGRLSEDVRSMARENLVDSQCKLSPGEIGEITKLLSSPMPKRSRITKLRMIKCPWPKGSLLAYRIATNKANSGSRFWNQYVLLRIVDIRKWPISSVMPHLLYDESMYVALYNWVGTSIPDSAVVQNLEITPISFQKQIFAQLPHEADLPILERSITEMGVKITAIHSESPEYIYALDWGSKKNATTIFTRIYDNLDNRTFVELPNPSTKIPPMIGCVGFDTVLIKRLEQNFSNMV